MSIHSLLVALIQFFKMVEMGKNSHTVYKIMKCYQSDKKLSLILIITLNNNKWKVKYLNMPDTHYVIERYCKALIINYVL